MGALYYGADDRPKAVGTRIANPDYAATLRAIAAFGADAGYFFSTAFRRSTTGAGVA